MTHGRTSWPDRRLALAIGTVLGGRYRLAHRIAEGGMGAVYVAEDERMRRNVAVKVLHPEFAADTVELQRFEREARAVAAVNHPGVVQVFDFGTEIAPYLVMEYVQGPSLAELVRADGRLRPARAVELCEQVLDALAAVHASGIIHRDLKPANVVVSLVGQREYARILDFGVAQLKAGPTHQRLTQTGALVGTPLYMSPEQARAKPTDERTDVYAAGLLLWSLLTGRRPYNTKEIAQLLADIVAVPLARADVLEADVPTALGDVVARAVEKDPAARYASAREMLEALRVVRIDVDGRVSRTVPDRALDAPTMPATPPGLDVPRADAETVAERLASRPDAAPRAMGNASTVRAGPSARPTESAPRSFEPAGGSTLRASPASREPMTVRGHRSPDTDPIPETREARHPRPELRGEAPRAPMTVTTEAPRFTGRGRLGLGVVVILVVVTAGVAAGYLLGRRAEPEPTIASPPPSMPVMHPIDPG